MKAKLPATEAERQKTLNEYQILDTVPESEYDDIVKLASQICGTAIAVLSFVDKDRQWFKSAVGLDAKETPRDVAFCAHAILDTEVLHVENATEDPRFSDNPLVTGELGVRFYAGAPLISPTGHGLGTLCVIDQNPKKLDPSQVAALEALARQVMRNLELRKLMRKFAVKNLELSQANEKTRLMAEEVHSTREFLSTVVNHLPVAVFCKDVAQDFRYTLSNPKAEEMWGFPTGHRIGRTDHEIFPEQQAQIFRERDIADITSGLPSYTPELALETPHGLRYFRVTKVPIAGVDGKPRYILGVAEDFTERKNTEMKLIQASKMSSLGEMASGIAHEINNPLAIIRGRAQLLKAAWSEGKVDQAIFDTTIEKIDQTCMRIYRIINGLRAFARDGQKELMQECNVAGLIADTLELCQARFKSHGTELRVPLDYAELRLECRGIQVSQVVLNLINNAFDAAVSSPEKWVEVNARETDTSIEISVTDSGPGVPPAIREKIMAPFFTTKDPGKGTGLGLSISRGIVDSHQGRLFLDESSPRTRFVILLPKKQSTAQPQGTPQAA